MRRVMFICIGILLSLSAMTAPSLQPVVIKTTLANRPMVTYAYSVIDAQVFKLSVKALDKATQVSALRKSIACNGVAITGGFSGQSGNELRPKGLVRAMGRALSIIENWSDGGVLSINGNDVRITRISSWRITPLVADMVLQVRPILVFNGIVDEPLNDECRWNRVAVGTMKDGKVVFIGAFTPKNDAITLREFAQDAISILGSNLTTLLNLDGGPSAFMTWPSDRLIPSQGAVTTYLCAESR